MRHHGQVLIIMRGLRYSDLTERKRSGIMDKWSLMRDLKYNDLTERNSVSRTSDQLREDSNIVI